MGREKQNRLLAETAIDRKLTQQVRRKGWALSLKASCRRGNKKTLTLCGQALSMKTSELLREGK